MAYTTGRLMNAMARRKSWVRGWQFCVTTHFRPVGRPTEVGDERDGWDACYAQFQASRDGALPTEKDGHLACPKLY